ncbi:MAG: cobalamin-binding protein [Candidatus Lokiarchaeota archaeon]|nr:cobalamin-binding protein [Candidatus Lokiarchaeota archaeon]
MFCDCIFLRKKVILPYNILFKEDSKMAPDDQLSRLKNAIINFDEDKSKELIKDIIAEKKPVEKILATIADALDDVGEKYENHEYYLSELMLAGDTAKGVINAIKPLIQSQKSIGKIVFGTVKGDIHDIGKTIISYFMIGAGFDVIDLGVEVDEYKFINAIKKYDPDIIAMSSLLSTTRDYMKTIIESLNKANLRNKVKIIVGGRPVTEEFARNIGADGFAVNPNQAVAICRNWMEEFK